MLCEVGLGMFVVLFNSCGLVVDTLYRHACFDDECVILKFNYTSCACLSCCLHKELVSIVGSYCTISLKSLVATLHLYIYIYIMEDMCTFTTHLFHLLLSGRRKDGNSMVNLISLIQL